MLDRRRRLWRRPDAAGDAAACAVVLELRDVPARLVAGLFTYGGWHMVTYVAEETREPQQTIPRALMIGDADRDASATSALNAAYVLRAAARCGHRARSASPPTSRRVLAVRAAQPRSRCSSSSPRSARSSGVILAGPRVYLAMARDGLFFRSFGAAHPRYPDAASRDRCCRPSWSSVLVATGTYRALFTRVIYTEWIFFALMAAALFVLRRRAGLRAGLPQLRDIRWMPAGVHRVDDRRSSSIRSSREPPKSATGLLLVLAGLPVYLLAGRASAILVAGARPTSTDADDHRLSQPLLSRRRISTRCAPARAASRSRSTPTAIRVLHYPGDYNIAVRGHRDIDYRAEVLERARRRHAGAQPDDARHARRGAGRRRCGWRGSSTTLRARSSATARPRFSALATLPLNDPAASARARARDARSSDSAARWCSATSTASRSATSGSGRCTRTANDLGAVIHIHPTASGRRRSDEGILADAARRLSRSTRRSPRRSSSSAAWSSVSRASAGCSATSAVRSRISPSGSIAASRRSRNAATHIDRPPSDYLGASTTTP